MTRLITEFHLDDKTEILKLEGYLYDPVPGKQIVLPKGTLGASSDQGYNCDKSNDWITNDCVIRKIKISRP